jgi:hypothetical protein
MATHTISKQQIIDTYNAYLSTEDTPIDEHSADFHIIERSITHFMKSLIREHEYRIPYSISEELATFFGQDADYKMTYSWLYKEVSRDIGMDIQGNKGYTFTRLTQISGITPLHWAPEISKRVCDAIVDRHFIKPSEHYVLK